MLLKCQDVSLGNVGGCQKTVMVQKSEVDGKKDNMDGFDMDKDSKSIQNVQVDG